MRRLLALLAIILLPGALVIAGLIAAFRYLFRQEDVLTAETVRRINADAEQAERQRDLDDVMVRGKRTVIEGPVAKPGTYSRPWDGR